jgi:hypothetical protein
MVVYFFNNENTNFNSPGPDVGRTGLVCLYLRKAFELPNSIVVWEDPIISGEPWRSYHGNTLSILSD